ncbi:hypothetical protein D9758_006815 [Tetrapyrgos nigripes]|uniref:protein-histidine N-methyltransferase n=1 Tax=Tetrapyrgos nigripes TaxID=182062 RepID=A0A8H5FTL7_9AGAR|nr:hypothetical protein D9758_006815 [Tetrapyrgos nigripes]
MFKFNFDIEDIDEEAALVNESTETSIPSTSEVAQNPFKELSLQHLIDSLPTQLSCSPLTISSQEPGKTIHLARRDLFDARFQLISDGTGAPEGDEKQNSEPKSALAFLETPSDLVPGVYEGGLKTWECSLDLAEYLDGLKQKHGFSVLGKRVLEIGCGTAVPSMYLLNQAFSSPIQEKDTVFHLQDYNDSALELVTFPNMILTWYMSPASESFRSTSSNINTDSEALNFPPADPSSPAEIPITPALKTAFEISLRDYRINLRFFSGSWSTFDFNTTGGEYNVVLASETIYSVESLPSLLDLLFNACREESPKASESLDEATSRLALSASYLCLVAAKVFYFGVGGGTTEFVQAVEARQKTASVKTVWEKDTGVTRKIMQLQWS